MSPEEGFSGNLSCAQACGCRASIHLDGSAIEPLTPQPTASCWLSCPFPKKAIPRWDSRLVANWTAGSLLIFPP